MSRSGPDLSRRGVLAASLLGGAAATGTFVAFAPGVLEVTARAASGEWTSTTTQNGWQVVPSASVQQLKVQGSDARVALLPGASATVLLHVLRRFHYEVEALQPAEVIGHRSDRRVGKPFESNHLSGTAVTVHPGRHPVGVSGTLYPLQVRAVRDILLDCQGVVRWGGDDVEHPAEGFFQVDVPPTHPMLAQVTARITGWSARPAQGAGTPIDLLDPTRRQQAARLERQQRKA